MNRTDKVYQALKELCQNIKLEELNNKFKGYEATDISKKTGILRNNVSKELTLLVIQKRVLKIAGRPVYYLDREIIEKLLQKNIPDDQLIFDSIEGLIYLGRQPINKDLNSPKREMAKKKNKAEAFVDTAETDIFTQRIVGAKESMEIPVKLAKAAILYPPHGLRTILIGPTGVGKTNFAEAMFNYAVEIGKISKNANFVIFNCAEYADNPQLLLPQLFGYVKGSFTGADNDKEGIIDKAQGGVLLLDEVHRLPPDGQEMLFLLMDKNIYRRMGEVDNNREANVLIICATTEDMESTLLKTFLRRIPIVIKLPSLAEKPLYERLQLIKLFFNNESKSVGIPIRVYKEVIKALLFYPCKGNIGQLKGDIQLTCARGFLDCNIKKKRIIEIDTPLIAEHIYEGLLCTQQNRIEKIDIFQKIKDEFIEFPVDIEYEKIVYGNENEQFNIYDRISDQYVMFLNEAYSDKEIEEIVCRELENYLKILMKKSNFQKPLPDKNELFKIVSPRVYKSVELAIKVAEEKLKKTFPANIAIVLSVHISTLLERLEDGRVLKNIELGNIVLNYPLEFKTAKLIREVLQEELGIEIPQEEIGFITMLLYTINSQTVEDKVCIIVLAHGNSTATSIVDVVNVLLGTKHCIAVDMPLDQKIDDTLEKTIELAKRIDQGKGILFMTDMGSLVAFGEIVTKRTGIQTKTIEMVSTPLVLEAVRKSLMPTMNLETLFSEIQNACPYMGRMVTHSLINKSADDDNKIIITTCITGEGTAIKLAELIKNTIPTIQEYGTSLLPLNEEKFKGTESIKGKIIAVVGSIDLKIPDVPFIPIDEVIMGNGFRRIEALVNGSINVSDRSYLRNPNIALKYLEDSLVFLNPNKAFKAIMESFNMINPIFQISDTNKVTIAFLYHCSFMIERILRNQEVHYQEAENVIRENRDLYQKIRAAIPVLEEAFIITIPDSEVAALIDLCKVYL